MTDKLAEALVHYENEIKRKDEFIILSQKTFIETQAGEFLANAVRTALAEHDANGGWCFDMDKAPKDRPIILCFPKQQNLMVRVKWFSLHSYFKKTTGGNPVTGVAGAIWHECTFPKPPQ